MYQFVSIRTIFILIPVHLISHDGVRLPFLQNVRWLNLTAAFWALVIMDAQRAVDKDGVSNFFEVMKWRAHGRITEEEFTALYSEWIGMYLCVCMVT